MKLIIFTLNCITMCLCILILLGLLLPVHPQEDELLIGIISKERSNIKANSQNAPKRVINIMRAIYHDCGQRIQDSNPLRFKYEETSIFEQGYLFAEIIERYRKMVEFAKRLRYESNALYDSQDKLENIQKLYFEIYHLVNMMHEIPRKYLHTAGFGDPGADGGTFDISKYEEAKAIFAKEEAERLRRLRQRKKLLRERQRLISSNRFNPDGGEMVADGKKIPLPGQSRLWPYYNKSWPLDYGWEVDFFK